MSDTRIAEIIQAQIGGRAFQMLGAHQLVALEDGLKFRIRGCQQGNLLMIRLIPGDVYEVSLWSIRGANTRCVDCKTGVYADSLRRSIELLTGLYTSLGTMKGVN